MELTLDHTRHIGIFDASAITATIVGVGGIGAISAYTLAKMGLAELTLWDMDFVEPVNVATQWHRLSDIGKNKAQAVADEIHHLAGDTQVNVHPERFEGDNIRDEIIISAVDSIEGRQLIWRNAMCNWFIDTRMSAEELQIYVVDMRSADARQRYESELFALTDESVPDLPCTSKATIYTANFAAGWVGLMIKTIAVGMTPPYRTIRNLPNHFMFQI